MENNWSNNNTYTYLQLADHISYEGFTKSLAAFSDRLVSEKKITNERVIGQKIGDIHCILTKHMKPNPMVKHGRCTFCWVSHFWFS